MENLLKRLGRSAIVVGLTFVACSVGYAGPTGLNLIPIADILRSREVILSYSASGNERNVDPRYYHFGYATVGILNRVEIGADTNFLGTTTHHVKLLLVESGETGPSYAVSAGFANADGDYREPYVVGRYDTKVGRLHLGYWRTGRTNRAICGADFKIAEGLVGLVDHQTGPGSLTSVGASWSVPNIPGLAFSSYVVFPSRREAGIMHSVGVTYLFKL